MRSTSNDARDYDRYFGSDDAERRITEEELREEEESFDTRIEDFDFEEDEDDDEE